MSGLEEEKQRRILEAATRRFARYGYRKTSIAEIAEEAGVGKGTVYLLTRSKAELMLMAVTAEVRRFTDAVKARVDPALSADKNLLATYLTTMTYLEERPLVRDLLLGNFEEVLPMWEEELDDLRAEEREVTARIIDQGIAEGLFRPELDVARVTHLLQDLVAMGLLVAYRRKQGLGEQIAQAALAFDLILKGLLRREESG